MHSDVLNLNLFTFPELSLASYYGDHMVLQAAPKRSQIWGYGGEVGDTVFVQVGTNMTGVSTKVVHHVGLDKNIWNVMLQPIHGKNKMIYKTGSTV